MEVQPKKPSAGGIPEASVQVGRPARPLQAEEIPQATLHRLPHEGHRLVYSHFDDILDNLGASSRS
jgi:hypothetical protein